jgi:hypothetical protein
VAAAAQIDPAHDPLVAALKILGELEEICEADATSLASSLSRINSKIRRLDSYAKALQTFLPEQRAAINSQMHNLKDTVAGFVQYEKTSANRRDVDHYMDRTDAAERLRDSVSKATQLFRSITY